MLNKKDIYRYTGNTSQLFYSNMSRLCEGRGAGMRVVEVNNGGGLEFTVYPDRAMDIGRFAIGGTNCSYLSKSGPVAPAYYDDKGAGWLKSFQAGFLATCGLTQVGSPNACDGEELGLHGDVGTVPASEFCHFIDMDGEVPEIVLKGKMHCGRALGPYLVMTREIRVKYGDNKVYLTDTVENRGTVEQPYMVLYHMNMGYPLLEGGVVLDTNAVYVEPAGDYPQEKIDSRLVFPDVIDSGEEEAYYYDTVADENGMCYAGFYNEGLKKGIRIWVKPGQLKNLAQWKNPFAGDYVMGIEPSNCRTKGRAKQKEYGLEYIGPFEVKKQELIIEAL
ncbi:MAG: aldose 1-epimerase family protein [Clostridiales bacterium]|nr:aldose 1-epimerase family protein [Clostridiales bacterium]